jgi:hypothetical protein
VSDQANSTKYDKKEQSKTGENVSVEVQQPKTSEGILQTAKLKKTKDFFSEHIFGSITEARKVMYGCALPLLVDSIANNSGTLRQAGVFFGVSAGLGMIEAAKKRLEGKTPKPVLTPAAVPAI